MVLEMFFATTRALDEDKGAKVPASFLLLVIGIFVGAVTVVLIPTRLLPSRLFQGESILVAPFVVGVAMEVWGPLRGSRGSNISHLGTWYGGAALSMGFAIGRLVGLAFGEDLAAL